jgi:hypothetical protein
LGQQGDLIIHPPLCSQHDDQGFRSGLDFCPNRGGLSHDRGKAAMSNDLLSNLTLLTNFLCMAISLWFAIYLLARGHTSQFTFRAVVALLALAFYYNASTIEIINPSANTDGIRSLAVVIALVAIHDLTYYSLPPAVRKSHFWIARGLILGGIVVTMLIIGLPSEDTCDPLYHCPVILNGVWLPIDLFKLLAFCAILYNLYHIGISQSSIQLRAFYLAVILGVSTIALSILSSLLGIYIPRFVTNLIMLAALAALLYSVAHYQIFINRRKSQYELPITLLTMSLIIGLYVLFAWQIRLPMSTVLLLIVVVIFTHSAYDLVREYLDQLFRKQEMSLRHQLRSIDPNPANTISLQRYFRRGLAILCHNLNASSGFIALRKQDCFEVMASLHSIHDGTQFPVRELLVAGLAQPPIILCNEVAWLSPIFAGGKQAAVIGIGPKYDGLSYSEESLYWLEEISDQMGWMIQANFAPNPEKVPETTSDVQETEQESIPEIDTDDLSSIFSYKIEPELIHCVEDGFRYLYDYSKLGRSPLVELFGVKGEDHIERGKLVHQHLLRILDKLRPANLMPSEPPTHEWYSYTILHDAYVEDTPARDIMAKLYISEGTYYRTRRKALRGITRALLEIKANGQGV